MFFKRGVKRTHHGSGWCCRQHVPAIFFVFFSIVLFRNWICFHLCTVKTVGYIPNGFWKLDFFARGTDASGALVREKQSVGRARLPSNIPSSVFLLADFCFGGRVTNADIFANSGLGSRLISSSGFFTRALSGVAGLGEAVPSFNISNKIWSPTEFTISFFSVFSALRFFDGSICTTGTVGVASVIGARGADTIGGATPTGSTLSGTFMKGNSLFGLNIFVSLLSTFSLSAFSFSARIDGGVNSAGGGISGFSRSTGLILDNGKSSGFMGGLTGRSRGFCFVYFDTSEDAKVAKEQCTGMEIDGRRIRVDFSITQRAHTPTPGIYMGKPTHLHDRSWDAPRRREVSYRGSYRRSPSPYYSRRRSRYDRSRSRSYSPRKYNLLFNLRYNISCLHGYVSHPCITLKHTV
ncbi:Transformer-2 sex-determining protein [Trachymyrmex cornetzi]|uniref:Transformer-2 sex-determining protein n=1 Tax=Trachymyrmex cornetzi TaxID=471704 RepID=A0A195DMS4_9HYME|nr:Transformer-2 sex-determining protein [Trachymyrmex cornetzi]